MSITVGQFRLTKTVGDMYVVHMETVLKLSVILQESITVTAIFMKKKICFAALLF